MLIYQHLFNRLKFLIPASWIAKNPKRQWAHSFKDKLGGWSNIFFSPLPLKSLSDPWKGVPGLLIVFPNLCPYWRLICVCASFVFEGCAHFSFRIDYSMGSRELKFLLQPMDPFLERRDWFSSEQADGHTPRSCHRDSPLSHKTSLTSGRGKWKVEGKPNKTYLCAWFLIPSKYLHPERTHWSRH